MTTMAVETKEPIFRARSTRVASVRASRVVSNAASTGTRRVPMFIPADEVYYWSRQWQADVLESMQALRKGEFEDFTSDDPNDVARWLLSVDEDDCD